MLIITPILMPNAIICDTEPGSCLHPDFERCFTQENTLNSRNGKLNPETVNVQGGKKAQCLRRDGNQSKQWAQWGTELPRSQDYNGLETATSASAGDK